MSSLGSDADRIDAVVADLVRQVGTTSDPLVNPGDRVEIRHPSLSEAATGQVAGCTVGSQETLVRLDGTHELVVIPARMLTKLRRLA